VGLFTGLLDILSKAVAYVLVGFEKLFELLGANPQSGMVWALSIVGLVIVIRTLLIPLFVKQIKATRAQQLIAPDLKKIQQKYKGKKDQASREAMSRETMALYQKHKTNPFASCLPMLVQAPIFFALFRVLRTHLLPARNPDGSFLLNADGTLRFTGYGPITPTLQEAAYNAKIFGARLAFSFNSPVETVNGVATGDTSGAGTVRMVAGILVVAMMLTTFLTQRQITRKNMPQAALEGSAAQTMKLMTWMMPGVFLISGPLFPIGVLIYWTTSNLWTMGQQYYVIRRNPTPGSEAEKAFLERKARKAAAQGIVETIEPEEEVEAPRVTTQRQQPKRKNRKRR
jgi:YidC/Oxa1 family membrane protein insertase